MSGLAARDNPPSPRFDATSEPSGP